MSNKREFSFLLDIYNNLLESFFEHSRSFLRTGTTPSDYPTYLIEDTSSWREITLHTYFRKKEIFEDMARICGSL
jgi:hypothetical protein